MNAKRAIVAGLAGTGAMTIMMLALPEVGLPRIAIGQMLGTFVAVAVAYWPVGATLGWIIHFVFGAVLALLYVRVVAHRLPGTPLVRGLLYGTLLFVLAQLVFMPLVGAGVFSNGDMPMIFGNLIGHLVYGAHVGVICGRTPA